jgi:hypothetical protein
MLKLPEINRRPSMGPPVGLPMNYDETLASRKRDVRPKKLTLEDEQSQYEDDLMAQYRVVGEPSKDSKNDEEAKFAKPADLPTNAKAPENASDDASMNR